MSKTTDIATIAVVGGLGVGAYFLYKNRKGIGDFFDGIGKGFSEMIDNISSGLGDVGETVTNVATEVAKPITEPVTKITEDVKDNNPLGVFTDVLNFVWDLSPVDEFLTFLNPKQKTSTPITENREAAPVIKYTPSDYTVDKNGKPLTTIQKKAASDSGINPDDVEIIGAPSTLTKEEREKLPTKTINELASQNNFIGRVFKSVKDKFNL